MLCPLPAPQANRPYPKNVWEGFGLRPEIPLMLVVLIIACCVGFLKVMESFAQTLLFGTFAAEAIFALYLGIESGGWLFYVACLGIGVYVWCMKEKIKQAALVISHASTALLAMPSLMFTVFAWLIVSAILVVWIILVSAAAGKNSSIFETSYEGVEGATQCDFKQNPGVSQMQFVVYSIWNWLWCVPPAPFPLPSLSITSHTTSFCTTFIAQVLRKRDANFLHRRLRRHVSFREGESYREDAAPVH